MSDYRIGDNAEAKDLTLSSICFAPAWHYAAVPLDGLSQCRSHLKK